jgi:hypothetical protein
MYELFSVKRLDSVVLLLVLIYTQAFAQDLGFNYLAKWRN